jgi:hypothetical protein
MRSLLAGILLCSMSVAGLAKPVPRNKDYLPSSGAIAEQGTTVPASVPLNARLIAHETTYHLDRGGLSEADYRKSLDQANKKGQLLAAPRVDLVFELQNKGNEEMQILVGGDVSGCLRWRLTGPGAVSQTFRPVVQTNDFKEPAVIKIPAGGSHRWVLKDLDCSGPRDTSRVYWTQAGEYQLSAGFTVAVRPAPKGTVPHWYHKDHGNVAISSGTVRITVLEK